MTPRELGSVYTPQAIARRMVGACLDRWFDEEGPLATKPTTGSLRVLDPACGDGAFLLEVFDKLCEWSDGARPGALLEIVRQHLFGVDVDPPAVATLRAQLLERIAATGELAATAATAVEANIRCDDSLCGPDFSPTPQPRMPGLTKPTSSGICWREEFPEAAAAGGFDIIVGNPPYLREKNAKALFDSLAATELGRRWRDARMDLWYYFLHRSLDLLRPGGFLSFIVNSYWMSSRGAGRLIERLQCETLFEEIELFDDARIFKDVAGRHMIFRLRKRGDPRGIQIPEDRSQSARCRIVLSALPQNRDRSQVEATADGIASQEYYVPLCELFQMGRVVVAPPDPAQVLFHDRRPLGELFDTRQGIAENPRAINRRLESRFPDRYEIGEGVFVLRPDEVEDLKLTPVERTHLRPYYELAECGRYRLASEPTHSVLYLTRRTAQHLDDLPHIAAHLERFRPILERRRETRNGKCAWWHLHWPREEIFVRPRVLSVQMGERPQFVFAEQPTFVGFSINVVLTGKAPCLALVVLTGILNSDLARAWFERHAKRRGINLEINGHLLKQFPLPGRNSEIERQIGELVRVRQALSGNDGQAAEVERRIEDMVERLYNGSTADI